MLLVYGEGAGRRDDYLRSHTLPPEETGYGDIPKFGIGIRCCVLGGMGV